MSKQVSVVIAALLVWVSLTVPLAAVVLFLWKYALAQLVSLNPLPLSVALVVSAVACGARILSAVLDNWNDWTEE